MALDSDPKKGNFPSLESEEVLHQTAEHAAELSRTPDHQAIPNQNAEEPQGDAVEDLGSPASEPVVPEAVQNSPQETVPSPDETLATKNALYEKNFLTLVNGPTEAATDQDAALDLASTH